jgi:hypothetical protein
LVGVQMELPSFVQCPVCEHGKGTQPEGSVAWLGSQRQLSPQVKPPASEHFLRTQPRFAARRGSSVSAMFEPWRGAPSCMGAAAVSQR